VVKQVSQISKELNGKDYLRVLMIYFSVFDLSAKDKETMLKSLEKDSYREIIRNMEYLDMQIALATKFKRRAPEMSQDEYN